MTEAYPSGFWLSDIFDLLFSETTYLFTLTFILYYFSEKKAIVIIGHGAGDEALLQYEKLLEMLREINSDSYLIMLHGSPKAEDVAIKLKELKVEYVTLIPILLAKGHHMENNIVSKDCYIQQEFIKRDISRYSKGSDI